MYYLELLERFWNFNSNYKVGSTGISMYLYLLKNGYQNERYDFYISDVLIGKTLVVTRKTVKLTRERLTDYGLIQFQIKSGTACYYRLLVNYPLHIPDNKENEDTSFRLCAQYQLPVNADILQRQNIETKSPEANSASRIKSKSFAAVPAEISFDTLINIQKSVKIPTCAEFIEYAQRLESYNCDLDYMIKEKYLSWLNNSWKNSYDRPITNWKSTLKSVMPYMVQHIASNEFSAIDIPHIKRPKT
ncbi:hypothetical protein ASG01_15400 [Chryseobacterium sp. Leaf180]|uniref:hypothetical protein n=1 Tax=Chryseobacterium sp. Leaf180 TaxID=1736289 RepID=UPI0006FBB66D|nr:hypothetical protein [Chryseobacterium sp. Leaf180]KQR94206.1 hypothetical protein ASG01_15400 [Chryseobacterium sp. Leaf180]